MRIWAVAQNTFKETVRNRVLLNILIFAVALIFLSLVVGDWSLGHQAKVIKDFGLSAMSLFGLLIAIFIGIRLMVEEMEKRTIFVIASKPIRRWEIVFGKYLGLAATLAVNVLMMTLALWLTELIMAGGIDLTLLPAVLLIYVEILLMVGVALFFSSFSSATLSAVLTLAVFIVGHLSTFLYDYVRLYPDKGLHWLFRLIYYITPNLENLNMKMAAVEHTAPHVSLGFGLLYGLAWVLFILLLSALIFERRDIK